MSTPEPLSPKLQQAIERHRQHFIQTTGRFPESFQVLSRVAPEAFDGYARIREWAMRDPSDGGHLPAKYKHLLFIVMDALHNNSHGALLHTEAAIKEGLTLGELTEAMVIMFMLSGINVWGTQGRQVIQHAEKLLGAASDPG
jgi:alkylhydroperoxidase/carboxymuconolactone decarboxylase family protein YurZ